MPWVESVSPSFRARHDSAHADDVGRVLHSLELARERLAEFFPRDLSGLTVVLHGGLLSLSLSNPMVPATLLATTPSARRYVAGWVGREELHVLAPRALRARASNVSGSREMMSLAPVALYARRLIAENNPQLHGSRAPARLLRDLRWAWLLEGAARWFSGQTNYARPAIARRLREGRRPSFPPGLRDAPLLGGTVIDLLVHDHGEEAAVRLACRLHPQGSRAALSKAFGGAALEWVEGEWRSHLARMATAG